MFHSESALRFIPERNEIPKEAWVVDMYLVYLHDSHVPKSVSFAIKVLCHGKFFCPPVRDVEKFEY